MDELTGQLAFFGFGSIEEYEAHLLDLESQVASKEDAADLYWNNMRQGLRMEQKPKVYRNQFDKYGIFQFSHLHNRWRFVEICGTKYHAQCRVRNRKLMSPVEKVSFTRIIRTEPCKILTVLEKLNSVCVPAIHQVYTDHCRGMELMAYELSWIIIVTENYTDYKTLCDLYHNGFNATVLQEYNPFYQVYECTSQASLLSCLRELRKKKKVVVKCCFGLDIRHDRSCKEASNVVESVNDYHIKYGKLWYPRMHDVDVNKPFGW